MVFFFKADHSDWIKDINVEGVEISKEHIKKDACAFRLSLLAIDSTIKDEDCKGLACWQQKLTELSETFVAWGRGILKDLCLGFGWAAMYFTVLVSSFNGKSLGKFIMRIQVVKLDNSKITFWDSFGRYGVYAAGITTGLLGFIQIYWDPNRQAIQDKISGTLVVDLSKPDWKNTK